MQKQSGNFLLQALLALTLVFAFMPFFANKLSSRDMQARLYSTAGQVETVYNVARIFLREEKDNIGINTDEQVYTGTSNTTINSLLEPYGLPMGFVPKTVFGQDISFHILKPSSDKIEAWVLLSGGNIQNIDLVALKRMIGFYATVDNGNLKVTVPVEEIYSDIVLRNTTEDQYFMVDLDMGGFGIDGNGYLRATNGYFESGAVGGLSVNGTGGGSGCLTNAEQARSTPSNVENTINGGVEIKQKSIFYPSPSAECRQGDALYLSKRNAELKITNNLELASIGGRNASDTMPNINVVGGANVSGNFKVTEGFTSGADWQIDRNWQRAGNNVEVDFTNVGQVSSGGTIYASVDKVGDRDDGDPVVVPNTGISVDYLSANNISVYNSGYGVAGADTDKNINISMGGAAISQLPDIYIKGYGGNGSADVSIHNDDFPIILVNSQDADQSDWGEVISTCCGIIANTDFGQYYGLDKDGLICQNPDKLKNTPFVKSLAINVVCQYLFWDRMDRLFNYKYGNGN